MRRALLSLLLAAGFPSQQGPAEECKQAVFTGTISSKEGYSGSLAPDLNFKLTPMKEDWGWVISVSPKELAENWTAPVTFPIATGEQQVIGTGYGSTVQDKMTYPIVVYFVLTHADFVEYSKLANETLSSPRPEAAGEFIQQVAKLKKGQLTVEAVKYENGDTPQTVKRMTFRASIMVPVSFESPSVLWKPSACPKQ